MARILCRACGGGRHFWTPPERQRMRAYDSRLVELAQWRCLCSDCDPWCAVERIAVITVPFAPSPHFRESTVPMARVGPIAEAERRPPREVDDVPVYGLTSRTDPSLYARLLEGLRSL